MRPSSILRFALCAWTAFHPNPALGQVLENPASELSPLALFNRCYGVLARKHLPRTHRYFEAVRTGTMLPLDACMAVLDDVSFGQPDGESARIIQTFSDFHRSWFPSDDYLSTLPVADVFFAQNHLAHDPAEPSYYVTRALFETGVPYASVVTEATGMTATRSLGTGPAPFDGRPYSYFDESGQFVAYPFQPPLAASGALTGVERQAEITSFSSLSLSKALGAPANPSGLAASAGPALDLPVHRHFGGGVVGAQSYLQLNFGRAFEDNDGGAKIPRRWAKNALRDLLCRDVPALRAADVPSSSSGLPLGLDESSAVPFRRFGSCMQCHATLDSMAYAARNLRFVGFRAPDERKALSTLLIAEYPVTNQSFASSTPQGHLYFRGVAGNLVDEPVAGLSELGKKLAEQDDLYVCAAARYFELFTGIRVGLGDPGDPDAPKSSAGELYYRGLVIELGRNLKNHQSLKQLIEDIVRLDFFKRAGMRRAVSVE